MYTTVYVDGWAYCIMLPNNTNLPCSKGHQGTEQTLLDLASCCRMLEVQLIDCPSRAWHLLQQT